MLTAMKDETVALQKRMSYVQTTPHGLLLMRINLALLSLLNLTPGQGISRPHAADMARALVLQLVFHHGSETVGIKVMGGGWEWETSTISSPQHAASQPQLSIASWRLWG